MQGPKDHPGSLLSRGVQGQRACASVTFCCCLVVGQVGARHIQSLVARMGSRREVGKGTLRAWFLSTWPGETHGGQGSLTGAR